MSMKKNMLKILSSVNVVLRKATQSKQSKTCAFVENATVEKDMSKVASMNGIANPES